VTGAETIVVGGGILGAATTWELAREGMDVLLLEAGRVGGGCTAKSAAIVRCHYSNPEVVRMAVRSREALRRLPLLLDCEPVYTQCGWLFLVDEEHAQAALDNSEMQEEEGVDSLEAIDELADHLPGVVEDGIAYALYEPEAGFADPVATTRAYAEASRRAGGRGEEGVRVDAIELDAGGAVCGVRAAGELLECDRVVLAAGPWTRQLALGIGLELPLTVTREQEVVFATAPAPTVPCAVSSQLDRVYLRPAPEHGADCLLAGRGFPKAYETVDPEGYDEALDAAFEADVRGRIERRLPRLAGMPAAGGTAGLYDVTPDWHPLLGPVDGYDGLHLACGGSGHCFKLGPAIGELVAWPITGREITYLDPTRFSLGRFAAGREFASSYGGNRA
jgi:glycine/D-amino acid oxidase-like deaminating enzyme